MPTFILPASAELAKLKFMDGQLRLFPLPNSSEFRTPAGIMRPHDGAWGA